MKIKKYQVTLERTRMTEIVLTMVIRRKKPPNKSSSCSLVLGYGNTTVSGENQS